MNKKYVWILALVVVCAMAFGIPYNSMVNKSEAVQSQWAQVEASYQHRNDLIGNLVAVVKGAAKHENETLTAVINARANATKVTIDPTNLTEENIKAYQMAQNNLSEAFSKLMMVHEQYPELKALDNFRELQVQIEGLENRISTERRKFNEAAKDYNTTVSGFPMNIIAGMFNFPKQPYFKSEEGADKAPKIEF